LKGDARELEQVLIAGEILRQQQQVIRRLARIPAGHRALAAVAGGHVGFHPEDRLDAFLLALVEELDHAEHAAVIGDRDRVHAELLGALDQVGILLAPSSSE
jgi:hypothetical protein